MKQFIKHLKSSWFLDWLLMKQHFHELQLIFDGDWKLKSISRLRTDFLHFTIRSVFSSDKTTKVTTSNWFLTFNTFQTRTMPHLSFHFIKSQFPISKSVMFTYIELFRQDNMFYHNLCIFQSFPYQNWIMKTSKTACYYINSLRENTFYNWQQYRLL